MKDGVTVIIPVYGDLEKWTPLAVKAYQSATHQTIKAEKVIISTGNNITECRNTALQCDTEFIIFLDADDTLNPDYIEKMLAGIADVRVPSVYRYKDHPYPHNLIPDKDQSWYNPVPLMHRNYIVVSAMIRTSLFKQLGGFHDYESLEDWDLWLRAEEAGATFEQIPDAVLHVNKRNGSRNSNVSYNQILDNAKARRK